MLGILLYRDSFGSSRSKLSLDTSLGYSRVDDGSAEGGTLKTYERGVDRDGHLLQIAL